MHDKELINIEAPKGYDDYYFKMTKDEVLEFIKVLDHEFISQEHELFHKVMNRMIKFIGDNSK